MKLNGFLARVRYKKKFYVDNREGNVKDFTALATHAESGPPSTMSFIAVEHITSFRLDEHRSDFTELKDSESILLVRSLTQR